MVIKRAVQFKVKKREKKGGEVKGLVFSLHGNLRLSHAVDVLIKWSELSIVSNACILNRNKVFLWGACMCHTAQKWIQYISKMLCSLQQKVFRNQSPGSIPLFMPMPNSTIDPAVTHTAELQIRLKDLSMYMVLLHKVGSQRSVKLEISLYRYKFLNEKHCLPP